MSCKEVGFFISHQRSFVCPQFKCFFHLWGHGGPDWEKEFRLWQSECNQEWTLVSPSKRRARLGLEAMKHALTKSSLCSRSSGPHPHNHVKFATFMKYPARKGYNYGPTATEVVTVWEAGYEFSEREVVSSPVPASSPVAILSIQFGSLPPSPQGVSHACTTAGFPGRLLFPATENLDSPPSISAMALGSDTASDPLWLWALTRPWAPVLSPYFFLMMRGVAQHRWRIGFPLQKKLPVIYKVLMR